MKSFTIFSTSNRTISRPGRRAGLGAGITALPLALALAACGSSGASASQNSGSGTVYHLKISTDLANGASDYNSMYIKAVSKDVEKATGGKVQIAVYDGNSLYHKQTLALSAASLNQISGVITNGVQAQPIIPAEDATNLPFVAPTVQGYFKVFAPGTAWFKEANQEAAKHHLVIVPIPTSSPGELGFAMKNTTPVSSLQGVAGLKVRSPGAGVLSDTLKALGDAPVPLSTTEIAEGMSSGTVQAAAGIAPSLAGSQLKGIAKGFFDTGTMTIGAYQMFFSQKAWNSLPIKYRHVLVSTLTKELGSWIAGLDSQQASDESALKTQGDWVTKISSGQVSQYQAKFAKSLWPVFQQEDAAGYSALLKTRAELHLS